MVDEPSLPASPAQAVLFATHLSKTYRKRGWFSSGTDTGFAALRDVTLTIGHGRCMGLVGESGSGKSTLARCLACIDRPDVGEVWVEGCNLLSLGPRELRQARRQIQLVFQGSAVSLNPCFSALQIVAEPLDIVGFGSRRERRQRALELMACVGLPSQYAGRRATEFSGGQRQRLAIARALALRPKLLILDESLAGLDLPVQARIVNLLVELQASLGISYLFISHDLRLAAHLADDLSVMAGGHIVEQGPVQQLVSNPRDRHTRALLEAAAGPGLVGLT
jgi:ABC-type glutathione transport system ATPase component